MVGTYSKRGRGRAFLAASTAFFTCSEMCYIMVSVMVDMRFLSASTVTYASRPAGHCPTDRGSSQELFEASSASGGAGTSMTGALSLQVLARMASLTTIVHRSLLTDGAKYVSGTSCALLEVMWDKRPSSHDGTCRSAEELLLLGWTCKKGTPRLWSRERVSDNQVKGGFKR